MTMLDEVVTRLAEDLTISDSPPSGGGGVAAAGEGASGGTFSGRETFSEV